MEGVAEEDGWSPSEELEGGEWEDWEERVGRGGESGQALTGLRNCLAKISLDPYEGGESGGRGKVRVKDKADRATIESVLDPRTRIILFKLLQRGLLSEVDGCVSTGKEANVYHASSASLGHVAVKIYKTSILTFKDRDRYVSGEFRYRKGYAKHNPRKMVATWAEKEMRNLLRIHAAGLPCPKPHLLKGHVLLMEFLGGGGWKSPQLKDAPIPAAQLPEVYRDIVQQVRRLFRECKLVHADLSEYNLLWHEGRAHIIDVSQSVEQEHPSALEFLRRDCAVLNDFFARRGCAVLTLRELFRFVADPLLEAEAAGEAFFASALEEAAHRSADDAQREDDFFKKAFIPQKLDEVLRIAPKDQDLPVLNSILTGLPPPVSADKAADDDDADDESQSEASSGDSSAEEEGAEGAEEGGEGDSGKGRETLKRPKDETAEERKARKALVKEENRTRRQTKTPKHVKKRKEKLAMRKK